MMKNSKKSKCYQSAIILMRHFWSHFEIHTLTPFKFCVNRARRFGKEAFSQHAAWCEYLVGLGRAKNASLILSAAFLPIYWCWSESVRLAARASIQLILSSV